MSRVSTPQTAFSSGEISPLLRRRFDYRRAQTGLAACRGFLPLAEGGFTRAPGSIYRGTTKGNAAARLISFEFAENDAVTLEFTAGFMRVWRYGQLVTVAGNPYQLATPYGAPSLGRLQWAQSADVIYLVDGLQAPQRLARLALDSWTITPADFRNGPFRVQNLDETLTLQASAVTGAITLTANAARWVAGHVGSLIRLLPTDEATPLWTGNTTVASGQLMRYGNRTYRFEGPGTNTGVNPPTHAQGKVRTNLSPATDWTALDDGAGVARITSIVSPTVANATVTKALPQGVVTAPTYRWADGAWSSLYGWPGAIELFDQRAVYAATPTEPRTVYFSAIGDYLDFDPGQIAADDAFSFAIAGDATVNRIVWLKRGRAGLHIGALGEEYSARATEAGQAIGPTNIVFNTDSQIGSLPGLKPIAPSGRPIFVSRDGKRVYEITYNFQNDANEALRLSRPATHLGAPGFAEIVWQGAPEPTGWLRRGDGTLCAMVYDPAEEVLGWAPVPVAGGFVESIAVGPDATGTTDVVTMVVARVVGGTTQRMVEELAPVWGQLADQAAIADAVHLYAAKVFSAPGGATSFTLQHLVGETVIAWTDAGEVPGLTVGVGGAVTLPAAVTKATIGLFDATHYAETLDILGAAPDGTPQGRRRRISPHVGVGLHRTAAAKLSIVERDVGQAERESQPINVIPRAVAAELSVAFDGIARVPATGGLADEVAIRMYPVGGAPMTVTALDVPMTEKGV